jgi:membrane protein
VSIVLLTFVFLVIFAYLPPVEIPWRKAWLCAFLSAVLYERGQFGLAVYFGQMDATSPYADAGAVVAVLVWLYYSAQVILVGADFTKVLTQGAQQRGKRNTRAA